MIAHGSEADRATSRETRGGGGDVAEAVWSALAREGVFDGDSSRPGVEWIQTHISHVFRSAGRVYKFRKPVDLGFLCFRTRAERNADCLREVALGRRLAPDVYLGVAPLRGDAGSPCVGPPAEALADPALEHCVVMRRLPDGRDALSLLEKGQLGGEMLDALADRLAHFHAEQSLGRPAPLSHEAWLARCTTPVEENFRSLAQAPEEIVSPARLARARQRARRFAALHRERFERRRLAGRAVDGHGDLHLQHVWYERDDAPPIAIDCLEFSDALRQIDAASEVAFLAMDLRYRGADDLAERFLARYARETDDYDLYGVVDYFVAYRAGVRAKVAALAADDAQIAAAQRARAAESARRHLSLAAQALGRAARPALVLLTGVVGTGKSSVAAELAGRLRGVAIASDRVRKRLLGVEPRARAAGGWRRGAYAPEVSARTYAGLLERALPVLGSGRTAILDATFSRRADRSAAARLAEQLGCAAWLVEVCCEPSLARERLARRAAAGDDPSDAGPETYDASAAAYEAPDEWPEARRVRVHTDRDDWRRLLAPLAALVRTGSRRRSG